MSGPRGGPRHEPRMHEHEIDTDAELVRRLLASQLPAWADLPIARVASSGTDHAIYRLGDALSVRLPRIDWAAEQPAMEWEWLPRFVPHLPLEIPVPLAIGEPAEGYPYRWLVSPWIDGQDATREHVDDLYAAAIDMAAFLLALQGIDTEGGRPSGRRNFYRGVPLRLLDESARRAIPEWAGEFDVAMLTAAWEEAIAAPAWDGAPVWLHGDLMPGNLLAREGRLAGVIDFGCMGVGEPATDLQIAWALFDGESREAFREAMGADNATWARGRGWALRSVGALPYYRETNPGIVARSRHVIGAVLADFAARH